MKTMAEPRGVVLPRSVREDLVRSLLEVILPEPGVTIVVELGKVDGRS